MSGTVNPQITDAIQQPVITPVANPLENLYLVTAQALSIVAQNAASAQQQSAITMQAATTQGVEVLYNRTEVKTAGDMTAPNDELLEKFEKVKSQIEEVKENCRTALSSFKSDEEGAAVHGGGYGARVHEAVDSLALSLDCLSETQYRQSLRTLQIAATAGALAALVKSPDQARHYENVLAIIKHLV